MKRIRLQHTLKDTKIFKWKLFHWLKDQERVCFLNSNNYPGNYELLVAVGMKEELICETGTALEQLKIFYDKQKDWLFGYFTYDLKNEIEQLTSGNNDELEFPALHFFQPQQVFSIKDAVLTIESLDVTSETVEQLLQEIENTPLPDFNNIRLTNITHRINKKDYLESITAIKKHIHRGNVYELNFCQEFYASGAVVEPPLLYYLLNQVSQTPFSAYYRLGDKYLACASPERFLRKTGDTVISQPIKGTIRRGASPDEDEDLKRQLKNDEKECSENVMIVDLVRNDLSKIAKRGSVKVDELFGIYTFKQVHQLISTVSCEVKEDVHPVDIISALFPMGSMTGAPKIRAMQLIEEYESTKRGLYSGAVGYITPEGDFDLNVVIRSILYNASQKYLSFMVGSAITAKSNPEGEYQECLLKAKAMFEVLS